MKKYALTVVVVLLAGCDYFGAPKRDVCRGSDVYCREGLLRTDYMGQCVCAMPVVIVEE